MVSKLPGAFSFMEQRPFDLVVVVRTTSSPPILLRRMELYYAERSRVSGFLFDVTEPKYLGDRQKFQDACIRALLKEVRSRVVARDEFVVWFYSEPDCRFVAKLAGEYCGEDENLLRSLEELVSHSRIINIDGETEVIK